MDDGQLKFEPPYVGSYNKEGMRNYSEQVAMITGASGNLGVATARAFQQGGSKTVLVDRSPDRLSKVFADITKDHLLAGGMDLTSAEAMERLVTDVVNRFGRIDVLVNTVGAWRGGKPARSQLR